VRGSTLEPGTPVSLFRSRIWGGGTTTYQRDQYVVAHRVRDGMHAPLRVQLVDRAAERPADSRQAGRLPRAAAAEQRSPSPELAQGISIFGLAARRGPVYPCGDAFNVQI
jgi:hypothetical protein